LDRSVPVAKANGRNSTSFESKIHLIVNSGRVANGCRTAGDPSSYGSERGVWKLQGMPEVDSTTRDGSSLDLKPYARQPFG
jgi:hypothetical protein